MNCKQKAPADLVELLLGRNEQERAAILSHHSTDKAHLDTDQLFTFSDSELSDNKNKFIRTVETLTGRKKLEQLYGIYLKAERPPERFWQDMAILLSIRFRVAHPPEQSFPKEGPVLVVANHSYGIIDGWALANIVSHVRQDYKIILHQTFHHRMHIPEVREQMLPINFEERLRAQKDNLKTRNDAIKQLDNGGVVIVFPAGSISVAPYVIDRAIDTQWKTFSSKLARREGVVVQPYFFKGQNSHLYQIVKRYSSVLGYSIMLRELLRKSNSDIPVHMQPPVLPEEIKQLKSDSDLMDLLRLRTYGRFYRPKHNAKHLHNRQNWQQLKN